MPPPGRDTPGQLTSQATAASPVQGDRGAPGSSSSEITALLHQPHGRQSPPLRVTTALSTPLGCTSGVKPSCVTYTQPFHLPAQRWGRATSTQLRPQETEERGQRGPVPHVAHADWQVDQNTGTWPRPSEVHTTTDSTTSSYKRPHGGRDMSTDRSPYHSGHRNTKTPKHKHSSIEEQKPNTRTTRTTKLMQTHTALKRKTTFLQ